ncbi:hypothetical protein [Streptomyces sp. NPDC051636]|uniref:hypothetical protein n=1 Tax=Streptomyces sp. NPDC051636 TaxID=3365663 RepID=UPI0037B6B40A
MSVRSAAISGTSTAPPSTTLPGRPPLNVLTDAIEASANDGTGYLIVHIPASAAAPHMVDGRYYGRGDKTKYHMADTEVAHHHLLCKGSETDALSLLQQEIDQDALGQYGEQSHFFLVAQPTAGRGYMLLELTSGTNLKHRLTELVNRAYTPELNTILSQSPPTSATPSKAIAGQAERHWPPTTLQTDASTRLRASGETRTPSRRSFSRRRSAALLQSPDAQPAAPIPAPAVPALDTAEPDQTPSGPAVLLLGPITIEGASGRGRLQPQERRRRTPGLLALNPGSDHRAVDAALWPASRVNKEMRGLSASDPATAPTFDMLLPDLTSLLSGRLCLAYNADFDRTVLDRELGRLLRSSHPRPQPPRPWHCADAMIPTSVWKGLWSARHSMYRYQPLGGAYDAVTNCRRLLSTMQTMC